MTQDLEINKLIIQKVKDLDIDESVKNFIQLILNWEFFHKHEERPRFTDDYLKLIEKFSTKIEDKK
jgi:hypothetical protein